MTLQEAVLGAAVRDGDGFTGRVWQDNEGKRYFVPDAQPDEVFPEDTFKDLLMGDVFKFDDGRDDPGQNVKLSDDQFWSVKFGRVLIISPVTAGIPVTTEM